MTFVMISGGIDLSVGALLALASVWCTTRGDPGARRRRRWCSSRCVVGDGRRPGQRRAHRLRPAGAVHRHAGHDGRRPVASPRRSPASTPRSSRTRSSRASPTTELLGIPCWSSSSWRSPRSAGSCSTARPSAGAPSPIGGNAEAARLAGINVRRQTVLLYVLSGVCCGIAALMVVSPGDLGQQHPRRPVRTQRDRRRDHRRHRPHRRPRHHRRLGARRADLHPDHQPVHRQQPASWSPADRQGRHHRRRRAHPAVPGRLAAGRRLSDSTTSQPLTSRAHHHRRPAATRADPRQNAARTPSPSRRDQEVVMSASSADRPAAGFSSAVPRSAPACCSPAARPTTPTSRATRRPGRETGAATTGARQGRHHRLLRPGRRPRLDRRHHRQRQGAGRRSTPT